MLKIQKKQDCKSYFKKDDLYDSHRVREYTVSIFGLVVYRRIDNYDCDASNIGGNSIGFTDK